VSRPDLFVAGGVLVLTGNMLAVVADALDKATHLRRMNGLDLTAGQHALTDALRQTIPAAIAERGHADVRETPIVSPSPHGQLTVKQAAQRLTLGERHVRRLAPLLGGRKINGQWWLDELAVTEYAQR
jgi:hypothetical protein